MATIWRWSFINLLKLWRSVYEYIVPGFRPKTSSFQLLTNAITSQSIALESCSRAQTYRPVIWLSWFHLTIINIQQEKHKFVQRRQGIEGARRLSSRCPSTVKLALLLSSFNWWCCICVGSGKGLLDDQYSCAEGAMSQPVFLGGWVAQIRKDMSVAEKV